MNDVDDRVLKTVLRKVAKRRQSARQQYHISNVPIMAYTASQSYSQGAYNGLYSITVILAWRL